MDLCLVGLPASEESILLRLGLSVFFIFGDRHMSSILDKSPSSGGRLASCNNEFSFSAKIRVVFGDGLVELTVLLLGEKDHLMERFLAGRDSMPLSIG
jgi:hypothetical protein